MRIFFYLIVAIAFSACERAPKAPVIDPQDIVTQTEVPHAQLPTNVKPLAYSLEMFIDPRADTMRGTVRIDVEIEKPTTKIWFHAKHMTINAAHLEFLDRNISAAFNPIDLKTAPSGVAAFDFAEPVGPGTAVLHIPYETPYNLALNSAYKVVRGDDNYIVTQMEPVGAREAFPGFDEPRFKVPFDVTIHAPKADVVYANTPVKTRIERSDGWVTHEFERTRPLPTYLIAFGAGPWDVVTGNALPPNTIRKTPIQLRGFKAKDEGENIKFALDNTNAMMAALEEYFGIPYPYEKLDLIAAPDYAFGAMENPGAIVYREYLLLMNENSALSQRRAFTRVHAHELAHQWFGNLVTPVWWEDIWLNEAFATWMGNKAADIAYPKGNFDRVTLNASLGAMNIDSLATTRKVREPLIRTENVMQQFDGITYRKGGGVLSMFESYLGETAFRDGVRLHMKRYEDGVATGDDFFASIADGSSNPIVVPAMKSFVDQRGLPLVEANQNCGASQTVFNLKQSRYAPLGSQVTQSEVWDIPVCLIYGDGAAKNKVCTLMKEKETTLAADTGGCAKWFTVNADGAGYYRFSMESQSWDNLFENLGQLNTREVLTLADSLIAGFRAGDVEPATMIKGMKRLAVHPQYDVVQKAGDLLSFFSRHVPEGDPGLAKLINEMYRARYDQLKNETSTESKLLLPTLAGHLAGDGGDTVMMNEYADKAREYLGLRGIAADKSALQPHMLGVALRALARLDPTAATAPIRALVKNGSSFEKSAAIGALGQISDPILAADLRSAALKDTSNFTGRQAQTLLYGQLSNNRTRGAAWDWLKSNFEEFVSKRVPDVRKGGLPGMGSSFCSAPRRAEVKSFFEAKAALMPGYERALAQSLERIDLCTALSRATKAGIIEALH